MAGRLPIFLAACYSRMRFNNAAPVSAPLGGTVELLANNARELDYGSMLMLGHEGSSGEVFFTLYGHLGAQALEILEAG